MGLGGPTGDALPQAPGELAPNVEAAVDELVAAGAVGVTLEVRNGDDIVTTAAGVANKDDGRPAEADDPVRIASISKSVLAVVVLQLVDEGALSLDTTVDEILPGVLHAAPGPVTVGQLLEHSSGLPDHVTALAPDAQSAVSMQGVAHEPAELIEIAQAQPWQGEPGGDFNYSNTGYTVLGLMLEQITGESVPALMQERVFDPVDMQATEYPEGSSMPDDALGGYFAVDGEHVDLTNFEPSFWSFGASLVSTVSDVGAFTAALNGGELLSDESLERMRDVGGDGYGLGLLTGADACGGIMPSQVFGQRGNGFGYNAVTMGSPDGMRTVTIAYTGGGFDPASDPTFKAANGLLQAGLASTCSK